MTSRLPIASGVGLVLAYCTAAALTSHGSIWLAPREGVASPAALTTIVVVSALASLMLSAALLRWAPPGKRVSRRDVFPVTIVCTVLFSLFGISNTDLYPKGVTAGVERSDSDSGRLGVRLKSNLFGRAVRNGDEEVERDELGTAGSEYARVVRRLLALVGALALILVLLRARGSMRRPEPAAETVNTSARARVAAHGAIVLTIDAMLADPDPRTAIIGAYARLLEDLEVIGASREFYEGPLEHLTRVLSVLEVRRAPLKELVQLFEIARFSEHSLYRTHRDRALRALHEVADDLAAPTVDVPSSSTLTE